MSGVCVIYHLATVLAGLLVLIVLWQACLSFINSLTRKKMSAPVIAPFSSSLKGVLALATWWDRVSSILICQKGNTLSSPTELELLKQQTFTSTPSTEEMILTSLGLVMPTPETGSCKNACDIQGRHSYHKCRTHLPRVFSLSDPETGGLREVHSIGWNWTILEDGVFPWIDRALGFVDDLTI